MTDRYFDLVVDFEHPERVEVVSSDPTRIREAARDAVRRFNNGESVRFVTGSDYAVREISVMMALFVLGEDIGVTQGESIPALDSAFVRVSGNAGVVFESSGIGHGNIFVERMDREINSLNRLMNNAYFALEERADKARGS